MCRAQEEERDSKKATRKKMRNQRTWFMSEPEEAKPLIVTV